MNHVFWGPLSNVAGKQRQGAFLVLFGNGMVRRRRTWRFKLAVFAIASGAALVLAELLLAVLGVGYPRPYVADEHVGTRLQPGFHAWFGNEGGAYVRANSLGFRDLDHPVGKSADELRIAVLGDSYVEAAQVAIRDTFWKQLEDRLNDDASVGAVTGMGFGVSGFGTAQELLTFRHYVKPMKPDVVILAMTLANDIRNNHRELEPVQERPFFILKDGKLAEDRGFMQHPNFVSAQQPRTKWKTRLINASRLLQVAAELKNRQPIATNQQVAERGQESCIYAAPEDQRWQQAWQVTESLVVQLDKDVSAAGARLVVVTLTDGVQVSPQQSDYDEFCRRLDVRDLNYGDGRIAELCKTHGIPVLNLAKPMRAEAVSTQTYFHGFRNTKLGTGHWNAAGHQVAGKLIAEFLRRHVLSP